MKICSRFCLPFNTLDHLLRIKCWKTRSLRRHVHPPHVEVRPEEPQPPVHAAVSLHTLVQLLGVVEHLTVATL